MNIPNRVRHYRIQQEMTQEELATQSGVTRQTIGLIEKGRYNPTIALCLQLSRILCASLDDLFHTKEII